MDKFKELEALIASMKEDANKIFNKGNKAAGVRVRKQLQIVKIIAQEIRDQIQLVEIKENARVTQ
jgi:hypothetical protein